MSLSLWQHISYLSRTVHCLNNASLYSDTSFPVLSQLITNKNKSVHVKIMYSKRSSSSVLIHLVFQEGKKKCLQIGTLSFFSLVFFNAMDTEVDAHVTPGFRDLLWKPGPDCSIWQQMNLYDSLSSCLPLKTSYAF